MTRQTTADASQIQLKGRMRTTAIRNAANAIIHLRFAHSSAAVYSVSPVVAEGAGLLVSGGASLLPPMTLFNPCENVVLVPTQPAAVRHLERRRNEVPILRLRNKGANGGGSFADQVGELFDEYNARGSAVRGW